MEALQDIAGQCLCGTVRFTARVRSHDVTVCHCKMCRQWAGGISLFVEAVGAPVFTGGDCIGTYRSSEWGERGFCKACGSSLFWKVHGEDRYTISAGNIDAEQPLRLAAEIFIENKPDYYTFANDTVKQSGEEAMADFMAAGKKD